MKKQKKIIKKTTLITVMLVLLFAVAALLFASQSKYEIALVFSVFTAVFLIAGLVVIITFISYYNSLVKNKNKIEESFSLVDVYLKMRFDLVPNLVTSVKAYMQHEQNVLKQITALRKKAQKTEQSSEKVKLSNQLASHMENIFLTVENYPELKADKVFLNLMEQLRDIENKIAASRRFYNTSVNVYNNAVQRFPSSIVANSYGFQAHSSFKIDVNQSILPKINLGE